MSEPFPVPPPPALHVSVHPWPDPLLDQLGHDPRSPYVERFWLPVVGPSGTVLLRRLAAGFDDRPEGYELDLAEVARAVGMGRQDGPGANFRRTVERVVSFGFARFDDPATMVVRRRLPTLTRRQLQRLPRALRDDHEAWRAGQPADGARARVGHLVRSLLRAGDDPDAVEDHLVRLGFDLAIVRQALRDATGDPPTRTDDAA